MNIWVTLTDTHNDFKYRFRLDDLLSVFQYGSSGADDFYVTVRICRDGAIDSVDLALTLVEVEAQIAAQLPSST